MLFLSAMTDESYMKRALALAKRAEGMTSPNPMVGAVIVKKGRIIGEGYHKRAGTAHAEVVAIDNASADIAGSTLYVTLEPCCHKDKRTPPCTDKIISSKIKRVVIAMKDPNPKVAGRGIEALKKEGLEVVCGILDGKAGKLNEAYIKHITTNMPFAVLKVAMTLDGKIATPEGESKWITGEKARREVHRLRGSADALLTAIGTVSKDDPQLTCRAGNRKSPVRIVLDPYLKISKNARVLDCPPLTIIVCRHDAGQKKKAYLTGKNIGLIEYSGDRLDPKWLMKGLHDMGITSILIEGGASLNSSCLEAGIIDKVVFFVAPKIIGGRKSFPAVGGEAFRSLQDAHMLEQTSVRRIGDDFLIEGYIRNRNR